jgi:hypothetical protein
MQNEGKDRLKKCIPNDHVPLYTIKYLGIIDGCLGIN